jgi:hypothetical protein
MQRACQESRRPLRRSCGQPGIGLHSPPRGHLGGALVRLNHNNVVLEGNRSAKSTCEDYGNPGLFTPVSRFARRGPTSCEETFTRPRARSNPTDPKKAPVLVGGK